MKKILILFIFSAFFLHLSAGTPSDTTNKQEISIVKTIEKWYAENMNYFSITALMAAESSILPVPSEMVIPPAVYVAMNPDSKLSILWIIVFGTLGAIIGASFNYFMSRWLGRIVVYAFADSKAGKLLMLSSEKIKRSENFFNDHGKTSTFIGRLIPVVRHLISIPAGLAKMNYITFVIFTAIGAGLWNIILAGLGYLAHGQQELINKYSHEFSYLFVILGVILIIWLIFKTIRKKEKI